MRNFANVSRFLSSIGIAPDNTAAQMRLNHRGEQMTAPAGALGFAVEGALFTYLTPTPGTGVALTTATQTAFLATAPNILIRNTNPVGGPDLILRKLRLLVTGAGTALTSLEGMAVVDTASRYVSGGLLASDAVSGSALVGSNVRPDMPALPGAQLRTGTTAIVASAPSATARMHSRQKLRTGIPVLGDCISVVFGAEPEPEFGALSGTAAQLMQQGAPAVVIPPQCDFLYYIWGPGMTAAPTFETMLVIAER